MTYPYAAPVEASFPGTSFGVRMVKNWLAHQVTDDDRAADITLVGVELAANATMWTLSAGSVFHVVVDRGPYRLRVTVKDEGGTGKPEVRPFALDVQGGLDDPSVAPAAEAGCSLCTSDDEREGGGLGLALVEMLADAWGCDGDEAGRHVWALWE